MGKNNCYRENITICCIYIDEVKINSYLRSTNIVSTRKIVSQTIGKKLQA